MDLQVKKNVRRWVRRVVRHVYPPAYVLGRVACLGQDVFNRMPAPIRPRHHALLNMQKVRCDAILEWAQAGEKRSAIQTRAAQAIKHLARKDVTWLIEQQERMIWFDQLRPVSCAVMDTFAELTDQRFRHRRQGWTFACHYSDLNHTPEFDAEFACEGLLPVECMASTYVRFFDWFAARYPGVPVYFIEFSAALDTRPVFRQRGAAILEALTGLSRQYAFLHLLTVPEEDIEKAPGDDFAYHFSNQTVTRYAAFWQAHLQGQSGGGNGTH